MRDRTSRSNNQAYAPGVSQTEGQRRGWLYAAALAQAVTVVISLVLAVSRDEWQYLLPAVVFVALTIVWLSRARSVNALPH
jgi:hypothetical protein